MTKKQLHENINLKKKSMGAHTYFTAQEISASKRTQSAELNEILKELLQKGHEYFVSEHYRDKSKFWQKAKHEYLYSLYHCYLPVESMNEVRCVNLGGFYGLATQHEVCLYLMGVLTGILSTEQKLKPTQK